jgi:tryptophan synthase alpha chain
VGFGVSQPEHVQAIWQEAEGVVVGSALVREIEKHAKNGRLPDKVADFTRWLKGSTA